MYFEYNKNLVYQEVLLIKKHKYGSYFKAKHHTSMTNSRWRDTPTLNTRIHLLSNIENRIIWNLADDQSSHSENKIDLRCDQKLRGTNVKTCMKERKLLSVATRGKAHSYQEKKRRANQ